MQTSRERLAARLTARMEAAGMTAAGLSRAMDYKPDFVRDFLTGRKKTMSNEALARAARELGTTVPWLLGDDSATPPESDTRQPGRAGAGARTLPVFGTAAGSALGATHVHTDVIEWLPCPPGLEGARDAYALYVVGESMMPRFRQGEIVFIAPHRPVRPGDDVILQVRRQEGGETESWIKEFTRISDGDIVTRQHNPPEEVTFKRGEVVEMHRIIPMRELLGM